jgi:predicted lysophospholipase L1 biosynthesis ABC-type transport system permease subunit
VRANFYLTYAARSLFRNGQRALLAAFCITVGVMAVVSLQLAGSMVERGIVQSARDVNQGDISVGLSATPLTASDLAFFENLRMRGAIADYSAQSSSAGILELPDGRRQTVSVRIAGPGTFPLTGTSNLERPASGNAQQALAIQGNAVASGQFSDLSSIPIGATLRVLTASGSFAQLKLGGIAAPEDAAWRGSVLAVSADTWKAATSSPVAFQTVSVNTSGEIQTRAAIQALRAQYPLASIRTTQDVLNEAQQAVETVRKFLILVGLLALLIGGTGIINTMQVLLARRRTEIAILKSAGYRRTDLYLLFSTEAAMLGLAGGATGAVIGVAMAAMMRMVVVRALSLPLPFAHDPWTIAGGLAIGLCTALIFGLLPIVRAARLRPQAVFRDEPIANEPQPLTESIALVAILSALFVVLAAVLLQSLIWALAAVCGVVLVFGLIAVLLNGVVWSMSHFPVPDHATKPFLLAVAVGVLVSLACIAIQPLRTVGVLCLLVSVGACTVPWLGPGARMSLRLALRNLGRAQARTVTTLLALLIGVFSVGSILVLGVDLRSNLDSLLTSRLQFNVFAASIGPGTTDLKDRLANIPGVQHLRTGTYVQTTATQIDGREVAAAGQTQSASKIRQQLRQLSGVQGFDVENADIPGSDIEIAAGRNLEAEDAGTSNVVLPVGLQDLPMGLHLGSVVSLRRFNASNSGEDFTVVGFYRPTSSGPAPRFGFAPVFAPEASAIRLAGDAPLQVVYMRVNPDRTAAVANRIQELAPDAIVVDLDDLLSQFTHILDNILALMTSIASLALVAGAVIVANAVALAMLEQRRELGILKAVGYTTGRVLGGVFIENGIIAATAGILGMIPISIAVAVFARQAGMTLMIEVPVAIAVVAGVTVVASTIAVAVAWRSVRIRPLSVLRYE